MKTRCLFARLIAIAVARSLLAQDGTPPPPRRAWMDAPTEHKARWEQHKAALTILDISLETRRHVVVAQGTPQEYHAHPTTAMLADHRTLIAVWNLGHGGHAGPMARSEDGGLTWRRTDTPGGAERKWTTTDGTRCVLSDTMDEPTGYLAATQSRDGGIQLITSQNHYAFNLAWLMQLPPKP